MLTFNWEVKSQDQHLGRGRGEEGQMPQTFTRGIVWLSKVEGREKCKKGGRGRMGSHDEKWKRQAEE